MKKSMQEFLKITLSTPQFPLEQPNKIETDGGILFEQFINPVGQIEENKNDDKTQNIKEINNI